MNSARGFSHTPNMPLRRARILPTACWVSGFSLVEVIVSIFIIGIILIMVQAVARSGVLVRTSKNQGVALAIARNELEGLRAAGYAALPPNGPFSDTLLGTLPPAATTMLTVSAYNAKTAQVTVSIIWRESGSAASSTISLGTLITQIGGLP